MPLPRQSLPRTSPSRHVWFRSFDATRPVYHYVDTLFGRTVCGQTVWVGNESPSGCLIPLRHAAAFGRPCTRCWWPR